MSDTFRRLPRRLAAAGSIFALSWGFATRLPPLAALEPFKAQPRPGTPHAAPPPGSRPPRPARAERGGRAQAHGDSRARARQGLVRALLVHVLRVDHHPVVRAPRRRAAESGARCHARARGGRAMRASTGHGCFFPVRARTRPAPHSASCALTWRRCAFGRRSSARHQGSQPAPARPTCVSHSQPPQPSLPDVQAPRGPAARACDHSPPR